VQEESSDNVFCFQIESLKEKRLPQGQINLSFAATIRDSVSHLGGLSYHHVIRPFFDTSKYHF